MQDELLGTNATGLADYGVAEIDLKRVFHSCSMSDVITNSEGDCPTITRNSDPLSEDFFDSTRARLRRVEGPIPFTRSAETHLNARQSFTYFVYGFLRSRAFEDCIERPRSLAGWGNIRSVRSEPINGPEKFLSIDRQHRREPEHPERVIGSPKALPYFRFISGGHTSGANQSA